MCYKQWLWIKILLVVGIHFVLPWYDALRLNGYKTSSIYLSICTKLCILGWGGRKGEHKNDKTKNPKAQKRFKKKKSILPCLCCFTSSFSLALSLLFRRNTKKWIWSYYFSSLFSILVKLLVFISNVTYTVCNVVSHVRCSHYLSLDACIEEGCAVCIILAVCWENFIFSFHRCLLWL